MTHQEQQTADTTREVRPVEVSGLASYSPMQQLALTRYARLGMLRRDVLPSIDDASDWRSRLVHKALYSTYQDLEALGLETEARLLRERSSEES